jgi:hypothetical protein
MTVPEHDRRAIALLAMHLREALALPPIEAHGMASAWFRAVDAARTEVVQHD